MLADPNALSMLPGLGKLTLKEIMQALDEAESCGAHSTVPVILPPGDEKIELDISDPTALKRKGEKIQQL